MALLFKKIQGITLLATLISVCQCKGTEAAVEISVYYTAPKEGPVDGDSPTHKLFISCLNTLKNLHDSGYAHGDPKGDDIITPKSGDEVFVGLNYRE